MPNDSFRYTADLPAHVREPRSPVELLAYPLRVTDGPDGRTVWGCSRVELIMDGAPKWVRLPWSAIVVDGKAKADPRSPLFAVLKHRQMIVPPDVREAVRACALGAVPRLERKEQQA